MNILFFDLETTGLDPEQNSIIEVSAEYYVDGERVSGHSGRFHDPNSLTDLQALRVNGHTLADLRGYKNEEEGIRTFADWLVGLSKFGNGKTFVCGHNPGFDVSFIKSKFKKYRLAGWDSVASYRLIDTCDRARMLIDSGIIDLEGLGARGASLSNIAKALGIEVEEDKLHTSDYDTKLTVKVYFKMTELLSTVKRVADEAQLQDDEEQEDEQSQD